MKKLKSRLVMVGIVVLFIVAIVLVMCHDDNKKETFESKTIELSFESGIKKMNEYDSHGYYKFGWIQIQGTNISVPILDENSANVVETDDYSYAWVSYNYENGKNRPVILGHNIINVSNQPLLPNENLRSFEELMAFTYYGFAKDNLYIQYSHDGKDEIYLIYAAGFYDYGNDDSENIDDKELLTQHIKEAKKNSIYDYDIDVNSDDRIITVKTCTRYFGADEKQEFIIDARKLREDEEIKTYQVKKNKNFEKLNLSEEKS